MHNRVDVAMADLVSHARPFTMVLDYCQLYEPLFIQNEPHAFISYFFLPSRIKIYNSNKSLFVVFPRPPVIQ